MSNPDRMPHAPWPAPYAIDPSLPAALPRDGRPAIVTVGTFDGVHRGHWEVLAEIGRRARRTGGRSILVTFHPHPLRIVKSAKRTYFDVLREKLKWGGDNR